MNKSCNNCRYEDRTIKELPCGRCVSIANLTSERYSEWEEYKKYQQREDAIREETTKIRLGEKRGEKRGIIIGERRKAELMAKEMLSDGVDIKFIAKYTKLSIDEINALK